MASALQITAMDASSRQTHSCRPVTPRTLEGAAKTSCPTGRAQHQARRMNKGNPLQPYSTLGWPCFLQASLWQTFMEDLLCARPCVGIGNTEVREMALPLRYLVSWGHRGARRRWHAGVLAVHRRDKLGVPGSLEGKGCASVWMLSWVDRGPWGLGEGWAEVDLSSTHHVTNTMEVLVTLQETKHSIALLPCPAPQANVEPMS